MSLLTVRWFLFHCCSLRLPSYSLGSESDQSSDHWPNNVDDDDHSSDSEKPHDRWNHPVNYVYDAAAERTKELMEGQRALIVNGVH